MAKFGHGSKPALRMISAELRSKVARIGPVGFHNVAVVLFLSHVTCLQVTSIILK